MPITIETTAAALRALLLFAGNNDTRYYLNSVRVRSIDGGLEWCATDGHTLLFLRSAVSVPGVDTIIPRDALERLQKFARGTDAVLLEIDGLRLALHAGDVTIRCHAIEGRYPDARAAVPKKLSGEAGTIKPRYLQRTETAANLLQFGTRDGRGDWPKYAITYNGTGAAVADLDGAGNAVAILMPYRQERPAAVPRWLLPATPAAEPPAATEKPAATSRKRRAANG